MKNIFFSMAAASLVLLSVESFAATSNKGTDPDDQIYKETLNLSGYTVVVTETRHPISDDMGAGFENIYNIEVTATPDNIKIEKLTCLADEGYVQWGKDHPANITEILVMTGYEYKKQEVDCNDNGKWIFKFSIPFDE